jgi:hypothetical protein
LRRLMGSRRVVETPVLLIRRVHDAGVDAMATNAIAV